MLSYKLKHRLSWKLNWFWEPYPEKAHVFRAQRTVGNYVPRPLVSSPHMGLWVTFIETVRKLITNYKWCPCLLVSWWSWSLEFCSWAELGIEEEEELWQSYREEESDWVQCVQGRRRNSRASYYCHLERNLVWTFEQCSFSDLYFLLF